MARGSVSVCLYIYFLEFYKPRIALGEFQCCSFLVDLLVVMLLSNQNLIGQTIALVNFMKKMYYINSLLLGRGTV